MRSLIPIILIVFAVGFFFLQVSPLYVDVKQLRLEAKEYDEALVVAEQLRDLRVELKNTLESFSASDLERLDRFLPRRLDTVRVILDIDGIAARYGLILENVVTVDNSVKAGGRSANANAAAEPYSTINVSFTFNGSYEQAMGFLSDMEKSLRLFDSTGITIVPAQDALGLYDFNMSFDTYWINR